MSERIAQNRPAGEPLGGVYFDNDNVMLEGHYEDQLSAYRAKRSWLETLENFFLLEEGEDFFLWVGKKETPEDGFTLRCRFVTTCGRYAFWRITHDQAPEAQALIETAHIPQSSSRWDEIQSAPDLSQGPLLYKGKDGVEVNEGWLDKFDLLLKRLLNRLEQE